MAAHTLARHNHSCRSTPMHHVSPCTDRQWLLLLVNHSNFAVLPANMIPNETLDSRITTPNACAGFLVRSGRRESCDPRCFSCVFIRLREQWHLRRAGPLSVPIGVGGIRLLIAIMRGGAVRS